MAIKLSPAKADRTSHKLLNSAKQSANTLSQPSDTQNNDGKFSAAEKVNLEQQSDKARHTGQLSLDWGGTESNDLPAADASLKSRQKNKRKATREEELKQSINRAVPLSQ
ncbi:MAG: hypothetical protein ACXU7H_11110 [Burkholderiaceae bacterium]